MDAPGFRTPTASPPPASPRSVPSSPRAAAKLARKWTRGPLAQRWRLNPVYRHLETLCDLPPSHLATVVGGIGAAWGIVMTLFMYLLTVNGGDRGDLDPFGRPAAMPERCLALGPPALAGANATLRCTFWCGGGAAAGAAGPAACLVAPLNAVLDMRLLRLAPPPGAEACRPVRETWADGRAHLACRWDAVELQPYGLRVDEPALALQLQLAVEEAVRRK